MSHDDIGVLRCPFNRNHVISRDKFQRHLVKCEKNFPPAYKIVCPYDATHRVSRDNIVEHVTTCPMRKVVEGSFIHSNGATSTEYDSTSETCNRKEDYWMNNVGIKLAESLEAPVRHLKLMEQTNGSDTDDLESQVHAMGIGRGRMESNCNYYSKSICKEDDDTEFVFGKMAIARGRMLANDTNYHHHRSKFRGRRH